MSNELHDTKKAIKDTVANASDAAKETLHRSAAEGEHTKREVDGDSMTAGEKAASVIDEGKHRVAAAADHAKREARENT